MLNIKIEKGQVHVTQDNGLNMVIPADAVKIDVEENVPGFSIQLGLGTERASSSPINVSVGAENRSAKLEEITKRLAVRSKRSNKKTSDYLEDVFRQIRMPASVQDLNDIIFELTDYVSNSKDEKSQVSSIRSAMSREKERFRQYANGTWGLIALEQELRTEGGLTLEPKEQDSLAEDEDEEADSSVASEHPEFGSHRRALTFDYHEPWSSPKHDDNN